MCWPKVNFKPTWLWESVDFLGVSKLIHSEMGFVYLKVASKSCGSNSHNYTIASRHDDTFPHCASEACQLIPTRASGAWFSPPNFSGCFLDGNAVESTSRQYCDLLSILIPPYTACMRERVYLLHCTLQHKTAHMKILICNMRAINLNINRSNNWEIIQHLIFHAHLNSNVCNHMCSLLGFIKSSISDGEAPSHIKALCVAIHLLTPSAWWLFYPPNPVT